MHISQSGIYAEYAAVQQRLAYNLPYGREGTGREDSFSDKFQIAFG